MHRHRYVSLTTSPHASPAYVPPASRRYLDSIMVFEGDYSNPDSLLEVRCHAESTYQRLRYAPSLGSLARLPR